MKIKNLASVQAGPFGTQLHKDEYVAKGIPMLNAKNVGNGVVDLTSVEYVSEAICRRLPRYVIKKGDILFGRAGSIERHTYIDDDYDGAFQGTNCIRIRCEDINVSKYLSYYLWLPQLKKNIENNAGGSTMSYLSTDLLNDININLPSKDVIIKVVDVLSVIDKKIRNNNKINDNLQQQLKLLYDYWFTQFDFPDENGKPYRSAGGKMVWNEKIKRQIPYSWIVENVASNSISTIVKPGVDIFKTKTYLATADVNRTTISAGSVVDYETRESRANMQPTKNSVWFAKMKNSIKHLYFNEEMTSLIESTILSTGFCGLQCCSNSFEYMSSFIEHSYFETIKDTLAHGATQEAVNNDDLSAISLIVPSAEILNLYHERTHGIYAQISKNICENRRLVHMRDFLLPMLMNGQATISE